MATLALTWSACAPGPSTETTLSNAEWDAFVDEFITRYFEFHPLAGVRAGRHEFDGKLPSFHPDSMAAEVQYLREARTRAQQFNLDASDEADRFEREYLISVIDGALFWFEDVEWHTRSPAAYGEIDPSVYVTRDYTSLDNRMRAYTQHVAGIPEATAWIKSNLRTPLPQTYVELGRIIYGGLAAYLETDVPGVFADVSDEQLRAEFDEANAAAVVALKELDEWFASLEDSATNDFALGPEMFSRMLLTNEGVDISLDELRSIAEADLQRNLQMLEEACATFAPGKTTRECVEQMASDKPEEGSLAASEKQMEMLRAFILDNEIVSIPGEEMAIVRESPPHMRWNQAFIEIPGPYEEGVESIYYISPPDPTWPEEEQLGYTLGKADLLAVTVHEVWPGHFLQYLHANRSPSRFGQIFVGYSFAEGWAHYTEEMMWEAGLGDGDPEIHIGQLKEALLRNVRFISALGLHTSGMTVEESERLFMEKAFQDPANARQQAARGTFDPGYLNYTLGKLMIRKLRDDWTASRGGRSAWGEFHDRFLSFGGPPVPMVREAMLGEVGELF